jgi:hypothetical protein
MPETDILNPTKGWDPALGDSMNPSFGFERKRPSTQLNKKAVGSTPWSRETANTGHTIPLSWIGRTLACVKKLKWYYEQYEDGYFTIIDWDAGGRHYVGRFTGDWPEAHPSNNKWDVQNLMFEEMPQVPMVHYPDDWEHDSITFYVSNDRGDQKLATSGAWVKTARQFGNFKRTTMDNPGNAGEWATYEYRGYGFRLFMLKGPEFGQAQVLLDGKVLTTVDCYAAIDIGPQKVYENPKVSLDIHRVKVIPLGTKNAAATATGVSWCWLGVMR